ncbi:MAG: lysozyme inhibitor LprI family protein [Telluria sp.]
MSKRVIAAVSIFILAATPAAAEQLCPDSKSTVDDTKCMSAEIDKADSILKAYLEAAKERISRDKIAGLNLDAAQAEWSRYRTMHCGDVYQYWAEGTYRYRASAQCQIDLARSRTHDIWAAYLAFVDSTPSLLPEPEVP